VELGFQPERLLTMQLELPASRYADDELLRSFHQRLLPRIAALPGVSSVGSVNWAPLQGGPVDLLRVEGQSPPPPSEVPKSTTHVVSTDYFHTMGIPLFRGRWFNDGDNQKAPKVIIINRALARRLFPSQDPIGRRILFEGSDPQPYAITGVVDNERVNELDEEASAVVYRPYLQDPWTKLNLVLRTANDSTSVVNNVRAEVLALDSNLALFSIQTMKELIAERPSTFLRRYPALLLGLFAGIALVLAAVGVYGVISSSVSHRTHEIGVRMALGAGRREVYTLVLGQGLTLGLYGIGAGLAASFAVTRLMRSLLFEVDATDPLTFFSASAVIAGTAFLASYLPARRATNLDPIATLRASE
jgi:putative ABC transport system permease protein